MYVNIAVYNVIDAYVQCKCVLLNVPQCRDRIVQTTFLNRLKKGFVYESCIVSAMVGLGHGELPREKLLSSTRNFYHLNAKII